MEGDPGHNRFFWPEPENSRQEATAPTPDWWKRESGAQLSSGNSTTVGGVATVKEIAGEERDWVEGSSKLPGSEEQNPGEGGHKR